MIEHQMVLDGPASLEVSSDQAQFLARSERTGIDFDVIANTIVHRLSLMTSNARWSAPSPSFPVGGDLWVASHTYPTDVQPVQGLVPSSLVDRPIEGEVVQQHAHAAASERGDGMAIAGIERHEEVSVGDHSVVDREPLRVVDHLGW